MRDEFNNIPKKAVLKAIETTGDEFIELGFIFIHVAIHYEKIAQEEKSPIKAGKYIVLAEYWTEKANGGLK